ncbi:hypothetical protein LXL04_020226 [Taraxacum kok-saghyz]
MSSALTPIIVDSVVSAPIIVDSFATGNLDAVVTCSRPLDCSRPPRLFSIAASIAPVQRLLPSISHVRILNPVISPLSCTRPTRLPLLMRTGMLKSNMCLYVEIEQALPYLYVPCSDIVHQPDQQGDECARVISLVLERALKLKSNAGSKRQHVHDCSLVRARRLYDYDASEQLKMFSK